MLSKNRNKFESLSVCVGKAFGKLGISPNIWTLMSLVLIIIASWLLVQTQFILAGVIFLVSGFLDMVDGSVARATGKVSKKGAYLDTITDRYVEGIVLFSLLFVSLPMLYVPMYVWIFVYFFGSLMTTYSKAAAKEKEIVSKELKGGLLERAERLLILFVGILLASLNPLWLSYIIVALAVLSNLTALQRIKSVLV